MPSNEDWAGLPVIATVAELASPFATGTPSRDSQPRG
jgi:hypothetical protein